MVVQAAAPEKSSSLGATEVLPLNRRSTMGVRCSRSSETTAVGADELYQISGTAIRRHKKIEGAFNPFDPKWEQYGEQLRQTRLWDFDALSETVGNAVHVAERACARTVAVR